MSVHVSIEYKQPIEDGRGERTLARRDLIIRRVDRRDNHGNEPDKEYEYEVERITPRPLVARFMHRYGDDLSILVGEAGAALRGVSERGLF